MVNKLRYEHECPVDICIFKIIDTHLNLYYKLGFNPNMVTTLSILFGFLSAYQIMIEHYFTASILFVISYYFDCVDGKLARKYNMVTKFGDYYDHFGDLFKITAVFYALVIAKGDITNAKHWIFTTIILFFTLTQYIHLGYQERIYNTSSESPFLNILKVFTVFDTNPEKTIQITKYFGCGTWIVCFALIIFFWNK